MQSPRESLVLVCLNGNSQLEFLRNTALCFPTPPFSFARGDFFSPLVSGRSNRQGTNAGAQTFPGGRPCFSRGQSAALRAPSPGSQPSGQKLTLRDSAELNLGASPLCHHLAGLCTSQVLSKYPRDQAFNQKARWQRQTQSLPTAPQVKASGIALSDPTWNVTGSFQPRGRPSAVRCVSPTFPTERSHGGRNLIAFS